MFTQKGVHNTSPHLSRGNRLDYAQRLSRVIQWEVSLSRGLRSRQQVRRLNVLLHRYPTSCFGPHLQLMTVVMGFHLLSASLKATFCCPQRKIRTTLHGFDQRLQSDKMKGETHTSTPHDHDLTAHSATLPPQVAYTRYINVTWASRLL
jgi:hypothetical protein